MKLSVNGVKSEGIEVVEMEAYHVSSFLSDLKLVLRWPPENPSGVVELRRIRQGVVVSEGNGGIRVAERRFPPGGAVGDKAAVVNGGVLDGAAVDEVVIDGREGGEGEGRRYGEREKEEEREYEVSVAKLH